jgi:hypothetical protein
MLKLQFLTSMGRVEIRCSFDWAETLAKNLMERIRAIKLAATVDRMAEGL